MHGLHAQRLSDTTTDAAANYMQCVVLRAACLAVVLFVGCSQATPLGTQHVALAQNATGSGQGCQPENLKLPTVAHLDKYFCCTNCQTGNYEVTFASSNGDTYDAVMGTGDDCDNLIQNHPLFSGQDSSDHSYTGSFSDHAGAMALTFTCRNWVETCSLIIRSGSFCGSVLTGPQTVNLVPGQSVTLK